MGFPGVRAHPGDAVSGGELEFLWLELTNACNLQCGHCYAESGPYEGHRDRLDAAAYERVLERAYARGCRSVQFIGGEPTLNKDLPRLIRRARVLGYGFVEVFSNLVALSDELRDLFRRYDVRLATSFYSHNAETHDRITKRVGSWQRTSANIARAVAAGIPCRAGVIEMEENAPDIEATVALLKKIGIENVGVDRQRPFGRGALDGSPMAKLCGTCAGGVICVAADGTVSPCIMSKAWAVGNVLEGDFDALMSGLQLRRTRAAIAEATGCHERAPEEGAVRMCNPTCVPCSPANCSPTCAPTNTCYPQTSDGCRPRF
jgi:sulfatase maturation enzyme AslB (radical SAM superfamily)